MFFKWMIVAYASTVVVAAKRGLINFHFERLHNFIEFFDGQIFWKVIEFICKNVASDASVNLSFPLLTKTIACLPEFR
jgi:hypothetical protein